MTSFSTTRSFSYSVVAGRKEEKKKRFPIDRSLPTEKKPDEKTPSGQKLIYPSKLIRSPRPTATPSLIPTLAPPLYEEKRDSATF